MNRGRHKRNKVNEIVENDNFVCLQQKYSDYKLYHCEIRFYRLDGFSTCLRYDVYNGEEFFRAIKHITLEKCCDKIYFSFRISIFEEKHRKKRITSTIHIKR